MSSHAEFAELIFNRKDLAALSRKNIHIINKLYNGVNCDPESLYTVSFRGKIHETTKFCIEQIAFIFRRNQ